MKAGRIAAVSLLVAIAAFTVFSWPLARYATEGIPSSASNTEWNNARAMIAGDHLQFLYHMWLGMDTFLGHTPWFHNLYEFNTGQDSDRRAQNTYYVPFSLFYTAGALIGGQAFGWNFSILTTFWLAYLFTWRLVRRYQSDEWIAGLIALFALILPFPWIVTLGGSPTGFSMMWVPILLYGLDRWVADRSATGAALAGAAIFFSGWSDTHVFFYTAAVSPPWCLVAYLSRRGIAWPRRADWTGWLRSAWPLLVFAALIGLQARGVSSGLQSTTVARGRSVAEVGLYSYSMRGLVELNPLGDHRKTYIGVYGLVLLGLALLSGLVRVLRDRKDSRAWALLASLLGLAGIFFLSAGTKNPLGPRFWEWFVNAVPPYARLRQADKIFSLVPGLLAVIGALALPSAIRLRAPVARGLVAALLLPLGWDYARRLNPTICLIDREQGAYRAVAEDAKARGVVSRAIILPLWPGDSHYASLYEHYVSLYRIRMVNGYRPSIRRDYREQIFERFESMNLGIVTSGQLDDLLARGVRYLLLHEDAFPDKVGSFPVGATLAGLLSHPRLEKLAQDGPVWSFRIREEPDAPARPDVRAAVPVLFPVRYWDWERVDAPDAARPSEDSALGGRFLIPGAAKLPVSTSTTLAAGGWPMEWHVRARGEGTIVFRASSEDQSRVTSIRVASPDWSWHRLPAPPLGESGQATLSVEEVDGAPALDATLLTAAGWPAWAPGDSLVIPATAFFHAGHALPALDGVRFRPRYEPRGEIFYSRQLYLEPGEYEISLDFATDAPAGTELGRLRVRAQRETVSDVSAPVRAGEPARVRYRQPDNRFFRIGFDYSRQAEMTLRNVRVVRLEEP